MYAAYLGEVFVGTYDDAVWEGKIYPDREDRVILRNVPEDFLCQMTPVPMSLADAVDGQGGWGVVNTDEANARIKRAQAWLAADSAMAEIGLNDPAGREEVLSYAQALVAIRNEPPEAGYARFPREPAVLA